VVEVFLPHVILALVSLKTDSANEEGGIHIRVACHKESASSNNRSSNEFDLGSLNLSQVFPTSSIEY